MTNSRDLRDQRGTLADQCEAIVARAEKGGRSLTSAESREFNELMADGQKLDLEIARLEVAEVTRADMTGTNATRFPGHGDPTSSLMDPRVLDRARGETFASRARAAWTGDTDPKEMSLGRWVHGVITGTFDKRDIDYRNTMSIGSGAGGGYLVPAPLSAIILDKIVAATVVAESGAQVIPMDSATLDIARITGLPTAAWKAENVAAAFSDMTVGRLQLQSKMLVGLTRCSIELFEDAPNAGEVIAGALAKSLALEVDRAALLGAGGLEPTGLANDTSVAQTAINAALNTDNMIDAIGVVRARNIEPNAWLWAVTTSTAFEKLKNGEGEYLSTLMPDIVKNVPRRTSTQITSTLAFCGDFTKFALGMRTGLTIEVSRDAADSGQFAFTQGQVWIRAYLRGDSCALYGDAFQTLTGLA